LVFYAVIKQTKKQIAGQITGVGVYGDRPHPCLRPVIPCHDINLD
jgi:hypothetical protein